jgi:hypothetical protein
MREREEEEEGEGPQFKYEKKPKRMSRSMQYALDQNTSRVIGLSGINRDNKHEYDLECIGCQHPVILKHGTQIVKHFAHAKNSDCSGGGSGGESHQHKFAKRAICDHLKSGGTIVFASTCSTCSKRTTKTVSLNADELGPDEYTCQEEWRYQEDGRQLRADVAVLKNDERHVIIEILHTHKTDKRPEPWHEVKAEDVVVQFEAGNKDPWVFDDARPMNHTRCGCITDHQLAVVLGYADVTYTGRWVWYSKRKHGWNDNVHNEMRVARGRCLYCSEKNDEIGRVKAYCTGCFCMLWEQDERKGLVQCTRSVVTPSSTPPMVAAPASSSSASVVVQTASSAPMDTSSSSPPLAAAASSSPPVVSPIVDGQVYTHAELEEARAMHDPKAIDLRCWSAHEIAIVLASNRLYDENMRKVRGY